MKTICQSCKFDLRNYPVTIELDSHNRSVYCPVCSTPVEEAISEIPEKKIFFDDETRTFIKWVTPQQAIVQKEIVEDLAPLGKLKLRLRTTTRDFKSIFYERVLVFMVNDEITGNQVFASPENHSRYGLEIVDRKLQPNENWIDVTFKLKGGFSGTVPIRAFVTKSKAGGTTDSALMVWPNFKRPAWSHEGKPYPAWNDYFFYFSTRDGNIKLKSLRIVGDEPHMMADVADVTKPMGSVTFPPEYVEIGAEIPRGGASEEFKACLLVKLDVSAVKQSITTSKLQLSVDFGTSNTCFFYLINSDPKALKLNDKTQILIGGIDLESDLAHTWIPRFKEQTLVPSELVFRLEPDKIFGEGTEPLPIVDYTIPPLKWRRGEEKRITTGFKWEQATEPSLVAPHHLRLQKMFLGLAFRAVMAELVSRSDLLGGTGVHPGEVDLTITYPLSMSEEKFKNLQDSFKYVAHSIRERTGINLAISSLIDESRAGEQGTNASGPGQKIFIDIGGGTTDISVIQQDKKHGQRLPLIVDSLRYAGNDFLKALASDGKGEGLSSRPLIELQRRIRAEEQVLNDLATFDNYGPRQEDAQRALNRFLDGLTQYIARVVAYKIKGAENAGETLTVYLLGNGWRFVLFSPRHPQANPNPDQSPQEIIKEEIQLRLDKLLADFQRAHIIPFKPDLVLEHPADPKTVVARGALMIFKKPAVDHQKGEPETFLGSDITVVTSTKKENVRWNRSVPLNLHDIVDKVCINNALGGFELLEVPVLKDKPEPRTPIQNVNIMRDLCDPNGRRVIKNAFNFYLENWYKRYLTGEWR
jgi:hypothetical protein